MDLNNLRKLSQMSQDNLTREILQKCNPQKIAIDIISTLEDQTTKNANKGEYKAEISFSVYTSAIYNHRCSDGYLKGGKYRYDGPLAEFANPNKASEVLLKMVREHITDQNIKLELHENKWDDGDTGSQTRNIYIQASVEW